MSMSTSVVGIVPPDKKWQKMKAVYDSCIAAGLAIPEEVDDFFDGNPPDPIGVEVSIKTHEYKSESAEGYEVYLNEIPEKVKILRFTNSW